MQNVFRQRPNARLIKIVLPGTHDSSTCLLNRKTLKMDISPSKVVRNLPRTNIVKDALVRVARTQAEQRLADQLLSGARYLDLRTLWNNGWAHFRHGDVVMNLNVAAEFLDVKHRFLDRCPDELVVFSFSHLTFRNGTAPEQLAALIENLVAIVGPERVATKADDVVAQTYGTQVIARRRPIIFLVPFELPQVPQAIHGALATSYDPSVQEDTMRLLRHAKVALEGFRAIAWGFRVLQLHYQHGGATFADQAMDFSAPRVTAPPNAKVAAMVLADAAEREEGLNIVQFDFYTPDLLSLFISANERRFPAAQPQI